MEAGTGSQQSKMEGSQMWRREVDGGGGRLTAVEEGQQWVADNGSGCVEIPMATMMLTIIVIVIHRRQMDLSMSMKFI